MILYTSVNHAPDQVLSFLGIQKFTVNELSRNDEAVLFKSYSDMLKNKHLLNLMCFKNKIGVVFCSALEDYNLEGVYRLDSSGPETTDPASKLQSLAVKPRKVHVREKSIIDDKIVQIKKGSLLNPLMSYIYTLSSLFQKSTKFICCGYLYYGASKEKLKEALLLAEKNNEQKFSSKAKSRLFSILKSAPAKEYRKAFSRMRKNKPTTGLDINSYEINYIMAAINTGDEYVEFFKD